MTSKKSKTNQSMNSNTSPDNQFKEIQEFSYQAIHDLKAPIRGVHSFLQLLDKKNKANWDAKDEKYVHFIMKSATKMQNLVQDLVNYYKVTIQELTVEEVNLEDLINQLYESNPKKTDKSSLNYNLLPTIKGSPLALEFLFSNLIDNSLTYVKKNQDVEINISSTENKNAWVFIISDNGIGIDKEDFETVFKPLTRLHNDVEYPGTGLGLAICEKVIEQYNGELTLESEIEKGTTITISLPKL